MRHIKFLMMAVLASSVANAELTVSPLIIDFGNVNLGDSSSPVFVTVTNTGSNTVTGLEISMTGNSSEFSWDICPSTTLHTNDSCTIQLYLTPLHYGKKKRKLNFDGYELVDPDTGAQNDVSLTVPVIGSSDPLNQP